MRDVRRAYSIGLPVLSMLFCVAVALFDPSLYRTRIRRHEVGLLEQGTVVCLVPAIVLGVTILRRRRELPAKWLGAWAALLTLGALFYAGEECSWGQNYVGWMTPERWSQINDQHETNLHNTSALLDQVPRDLLSLGAGVCFVSSVVLYSARRRWNSRTEARSWFFPTTAVLPAAAIAISVGLPQKIWGNYDKSNEAVAWFGEMFFAGRHSELKEYFLAMFILMYVWSFATRLRTMAEAKPDAASPTTDSSARDHRSPVAADRHAA